MKTRLPFLALLGCLALAAPGRAGEVTVNYHEPEHFTDVQLGGMPREASREVVFEQLNRHLARLAERYLAPDEKLEVTIRDIDMAGEFEPWRGPQWLDVRMVRDIYLPRIALDYRLLGPDGRVIAEDSENLTDLSFQWKVRTLDHEATKFEKELLEDWMRNRFGRRS